MGLGGISGSPSFRAVTEEIKLNREIPIKRPLINTITIITKNSIKSLLVVCFGENIGNIIINTIVKAKRMISFLLL